MSLITKRLFDLLCATVGMLILFPLFIVVPVIIRADSVGPVFFRQVRVGRNGSLFRIFKFRTMAAANTNQGLGITAAGDARITRVGACLRKYKLDELPQLFNVIFGDMSLVGPRPELPVYVALYPPDVRDVVLSVRPGITDLASIEFRDESELLGAADDPEQFYIIHVMPKKLELYMRYVEERSLLFDIGLILRTLASL